MPGKDLKTASRVNIIRGVLTALTTTRALEYPVSLDVAPMVNPFTGVGYYSPAKGTVKRFWKVFGVSTPSPSKDKEKSSWKRYHISTKKGPNGPALWSALADLGCLPDDLKASISFIGGDRLRSNLEVLTRHYHRFEDWFPVKGRFCRRLVAIPDMEKSRVIAILDFWSQTSLKPVHDFLFGILRRVPQDVTFDQSRFLELVRS